MNRTSIGFSPLNTATTLDFQLPNTTFPDTVKEILLYATVRCGYSNQQPTTVTEIPFYVEENGIQYAKFLNMINYPQNAWNTNSDNMWFHCLPTEWCMFTCPQHLQATARQASLLLVIAKITIMHFRSLAVMTSLEHQAAHITEFYIVEY